LPEFVVDLTITANVLEKILYVENKNEVRSAGLEMLLLFLEDLENPDPPQTKFVVAAEQ
jgi:hypothetical protein